MNKYLTAALILLTLLAGVYLYKKYRVPPGIKFNALELTDLSGGAVRLQDYQGKKLFVSFFATWCGPCVREFPALEQAAEALAPDNFLFVSISDEPVGLLNRFNERIRPSHIVVLHSVRKLHDLGVFTVPTNYVLNDKGKVVFEKTDDEDWGSAEMQEQLKQKTQ